MTDHQKFYRKLILPFCSIGLGLVLAAGLQGQTSQPAKTASKPDQAQNAERNDTTNKRISPQEAQELFSQVDQILKFASKDSDLPIKREVKRRLTNRDEVVAYLEKSMREDKSAQRVQRSELVLKKFGLLPRDFTLSSFLVALLREQIAGFYDPKTKTMNLLDWVPLDQQRPVLAHELTHALQDQSFNLDKWMKAGDEDIDKKKEITPADIVADETDEVKEAVVEGQAETVMLDYVLAGSGKSVADAPEVIDALDADMMAGSSDSVEFKSAPIFLKESLTFPYRYGVKFVTAVLKDEGKQKAFADVFSNPPRITRQIMEPQTYLSGETITPLPLPDFKQDFKDYERFDLGAIGEFDVSMLIDQYASVDESKRMYPNWRGGYYYSVLPKGSPSAPLGLLYVSRWANAEKAQEFGAIYAKALTQRYKEVKDTGDSSDDLAKLETLTGKHSWQTEDGAVVIEVEADTVMVAESLDSAATDALERDVFSAVSGK